jgi:putative ABC transport system permease protein
MLERVQALPGVQSAGLTEITPLSQEETSRGFEVENRPPLAPGHFTAAQYRRISPNYFATLGIPLVQGRAFADRDDADAPGVAVISVTMARRYWPNEDPLGKNLIIRDGGRNPREVIGVVGDVKHTGLDKQSQPVMYVPVAQRAVDRMTLVVRTAADPRPMINAVQGSIWSVDKDQPVFKIQTMDQIVAASVAAPRFAWILLGVFAGVALLLAAVGIYGVMAYAVTQRTQEIGVRMALGAQSSDLLKLLIFQGAKLTILGVTGGVLGALALTRLMGNLLFGVSASDPAIFAGVTFFLTAVALLASYLPARKATKVDPIEALRCE